MEHRIQTAARQAVETLEQRRLLASISGTVIEDLDNDGTRDGRERALAGVTVFLDQNRNRQLDLGEASTLTNEAGYYEFTGLAPGQYFVGQLPPASYGQNSPPKSGFGNFGGNFDITLAFAESVPDSLKSIVESAAARWEKVLVGDLTGVFDSRYGDIDDILIEIFAKRIDGTGSTLAFAGPDFYRDADAPRGANLPYRASATLDTSDLKDPALFEVAIHELGHALGFTLFSWFKFDNEETNFSLVGGRAGSPIFLGENATREYREIFDRPGAPGVPLEPTGAGEGSEFSHFSEELFGNELMSPFTSADGFGQPLSRVTVGLFQDLGYKVDYRGADVYDPDIQNLPTTAPETAGGGLVDFSYTITIDDPNATFQGRDFSNRLNQRPTLDALRSENAMYAVNDIVKLRAIGANDNDPGDSVTAVSFYVESNNTPGLQTGTGGDTFVKTDPSPQGGFRVNANTESLGLGAGTHTFYARAFDQLLTTGRTRQVEVQIFDTTVAPRKPIGLRATPLSSSEVFLQWTDKSDNEFGFVIDRARDQFFTRDVKRFTFNRSIERHVDSGLDSGTTYYYRVRAFNIAGPSGFTGPASALTLSLGERIIDVNSSLASSSPQVSTRGETFAIGDGQAIGSQSLGLAGRASINFSPEIEFDGEYFLYAKWSDPISDRGVGVFDVRDARGRQQRPATVDQNTQGTDNGYVLIGRYAFNTAGTGAITFRPSDRSQTVNLDAIRLFPAFDPTTWR